MPTVNVLSFILITILALTAEKLKSDVTSLVVYPEFQLCVLPEPVHVKGGPPVAGTM